MAPGAHIVQHGGHVCEDALNLPATGDCVSRCPVPAEGSVDLPVVADTVADPLALSAGCDGVILVGRGGTPMLAVWP